MGKADRLKRWLLVGGALGSALLGGTADGQSRPTSPQQMVELMIARELMARNDSAHFAYLSEERSERTKGQLWTERMVETEWGTVRFLLAVDGRKLTPGQTSAERSKLAEQTANPEIYRQQELKEDDGEHSRQMLQMLPRAFLFKVLQENDREIVIGYSPNPGYTPRTLEERALHGMTGTLTLDAKSLRLQQLEGRAPNDVSLGLGPFATLKAGSSFSTAREPTQEAVWKTSRLRTSIQGRALLLKTIARQQDYVHTGFVRLPPDLSLKQAVEVAER